MIRLLVFLLVCSPLWTNAQKIEIIKPTGGFKEIDFSKPTFSTQPTPIPKANGTYKSTHLMEVVCDDAKESATVLQYINITNGVVGISSELLKKWEGNKETLEGLEHLHHWAILPNMTQRMYVNTPETGKMVMEMTAGDGLQTTTMARFDAYMLGEIFWNTAKKFRTYTIPQNLVRLSENQKKAPAFEVEIYEYTGDEGKVHVWLKDLGVAEGQYAPLKNTYAATGLGGMGWVYNTKNKHVYLVVQVNDAPNTKGCRLVGLYPKVQVFSGAGYKPMGDMMMPKLEKNRKELDQNYEKDLADVLAQEDDAQIRVLLKEQAELQRQIAQKANDNMTNAAMLNDASEITRSTIGMALDAETNYKMTDIELRIQLRRHQIELANDNITSEERTQINKKINCINQQRQHWNNYRTDAKKLKEKIKHLEQYEQVEKMRTLMADYQQRSMNLCR
ncbi:MAG: hypothetical protein ACK41O_16990 [Runella zeae]